MISTLSVIFTVVVLDVAFNHEEEEKVPEWAQILTRAFMAPIACWHVKCCGNRQITPMRDEEMIPIKAAPNGNNNNEDTPNKANKSPYINGKVKMQEENSERKKSPWCCCSNNGQKRVYTWKEIGLIMDRCFMYIFIALVTIPSIVCLSLLIAKYAEYD